MRHLTKGRVLVLVGLLIALALVGASDVAAFLITGPEGHSPPPAPSSTPPKRNSAAGGCTSSSPAARFSP